MQGAQGVRRIEMALNNGYRLLDSAFNYENEGTVGRAFATVVFRVIKLQLRLNYQDVIILIKLH